MSYGGFRLVDFPIFKSLGIFEKLNMYVQSGSQSIGTYTIFLK